MVYAVGVIGFLSGFVLGQLVLAYLLRGRSKEELLNDATLRWKYGILNWLIAALTAYSAVSLYHTYF